MSGFEWWFVVGMTTLFPIILCLVGHVLARWLP